MSCPPTENADCKATVCLREKEAWKPPLGAKKSTLDEEKKEQKQDKQWEKETKEHKQNKQQEEENKQQEKQQGEEQKPAVCVQCGQPVSSSRQKQYWEAVAFTDKKLRSMTEENPRILLKPEIYLYHHSMYRLICFFFST